MGARENFCMGAMLYYIFYQDISEIVTNIFNVFMRLNPNFGRTFVWNLYEIKDWFKWNLANKDLIESLIYNFIRLLTNIRF